MHYKLHTSQLTQKEQHPCHLLHKLMKQYCTPRIMTQTIFNITNYSTDVPTSSSTLIMTDISANNNSLNYSHKIFH